MKTIGIAALILLSVQAFAQHPLKNKGPKAKNVKHSFQQNYKPTTVSIYASTSDKYGTGANVKNRKIARNESPKIIATSNQRIIRGKGANAKNKYVRVSTVNKTDNNLELRQGSTQKQLDTENTIL